jgi:hypothetical protein
VVVSTPTLLIFHRPHAMFLHGGKFFDTQACDVSCVNILCAPVVVVLRIHQPNDLTGFKLIGFWDLRTSFLTSKYAR